MQATEAGGGAQVPAILDEALGRVLASQGEPDERAKATHLPAGQLVRGMAGKSRIAKRLHRGKPALLDRMRQGERIGVHAAYAQFQGLETALQEPRLEGTGNRAADASPIDDPRDQFFVARDDVAKQKIGMSIAGFRVRIHDRVRAKFQWTLADGAHQGVVDDKGRSGRPRLARAIGNVNQIQPRVGRRFQQDEAKAFERSTRDVPGRAGLDRDPMTCEILFGGAARAHVGVRLQQDPVARAQQARVQRDDRRAA